MQLLQVELFIYKSKRYEQRELPESQNYLLQLAAAAEAAGLITGIRWGVPREANWSH